MAQWRIPVSEAAEQLGVTPGRVRALIRADRLDARKIGGCWWVCEVSLSLLSYQERRPGRPRKAPKDGNEVKTYICHGTVTGGRYLGMVEARSPQEAREKAWALDTGPVSLCHQCEALVENLEVSAVEVVEEDA